MGVAAYLVWASAAGVWGFALDDAWIHQTYARNLVATGQFAFVPGQPSSGSTSPLWTLLIALGYLVRVDYKWWTYALGAVCLAATALGVWQLTLRLFPDHPRAALMAGIFCALEWHLVWAAVSGMETVLFTALSVWLLVVTLNQKSEIGNQTSMGLLCGLLVLTRPEGLLLVGLVLLAQIAQRGWARRVTWTSLAWTLAAMAILLAPWLAFNWRASGTLLPNTFYAKQREYASILARVPFAQRLAQVFFTPFIGAQVLLIPGLIAAIGALVRRTPERRIGKPETWPQLAGLVWAVAHLGLYALRLPVTYQHGRYEMPVIPVLIAFGLGGTATLLRWSDARLWLRVLIRAVTLATTITHVIPAGIAFSLSETAMHLRLNDASRWLRVLSRAVTLAIAITQLSFAAIGALAYAADVAIIEGEMVRVARWLDANAAPSDLIAAHDIGAIGYFSRRPLLDLAGLISPEVIPFIRDEDRLEALIRQRGAAYLVTFPAWYPRLASQAGLIPVFAGNAIGSPEHLTVYRIP
jgi:4-amino-4-deoxy-L-arabinose transferase-like glycosyltransferase